MRYDTGHTSSDPKIKKVCDFPFTARAAETSQVDILSKCTHPGLAAMATAFLGSCQLELT